MPISMAKGLNVTLKVRLSLYARNKGKQWNG